MRINICFVAKVNGCICTFPITYVSISAQDELLQSDTLKGDGFNGGDIMPSTLSLLFSIFDEWKSRTNVFFKKKS